MSTSPGPHIAPSPAEQFFGLSLRPFSLTPDLRFAFQSRSHSHAMAQVSEALRRREGLVVVTGAIGTGKTMLCRAMLDNFETRTFLSVILDPRLDAEELMRQVLIDFGIMERVEPGTASQTLPSRHQMVSALQQFLASLIPLQAHAVIMIDEAQHLSTGVLEEIRLLSNFETAEAKLLQIVLVGQPDLEEVLRRPDMRQLHQRVARHCQLYPLSASEVTEYIERRLAVASSSDGREPAGETGTVRFSASAVRAVADLSGGIPRLVNTVCDRALDAAFERQIHLVDPDAVITAAERLHLELPAQMVRSGRAQEPVVQAAPLLDMWRPDSAGPSAIEEPQVESAATPGAWRVKPLAAAAAIVVVLAGGTWWWAQRAGGGGSTTSGAASTASGAAVSPTVAPPAAPAAAPSDATATDTRAVPSVAAPAVDQKPAAADTSSQSGFTIAVASFRTEQRAREVATAVSSLQLPATVRQDASSSWFAVVAGPFSSRESAESAQAVLTRNGYPDTRLSSAAPDSRPQPQ